MSSKQLIQQQYYTRAREGIFRNSEGFDTVARSSGLDNNFIKNTLHPFCTYTPPKELIQKSEKDEESFPKSLTVFSADSGELVVGRSNHLVADFTGQRGAIFVHNFIIPKSLKEQFILHPNALFRNTQFQSSYDTSQGKELPELEAIGHNKDSYLDGAQRILEQLQITEQQLKQLIKAVMTAIVSKKKVYVILDCEIHLLSYYANRLTEIIYNSLPYELRRHFGFSTYQAEPTPKKNIHLMFVESGSFRVGDRNIEREYTFDFLNQKFRNVESLDINDILVRFIWENRFNQAELQQLFAFIDNGMYDFDTTQKLNYAHYAQLTSLYNIYKRDFIAYEQNKEGTLNCILQYLNKDNYLEKNEIRNLFANIVNIEKIKGDSAGYSDEYVKALLTFSRLNKVAYEEQIITILINSIHSHSPIHKKAYMARIVEQFKKFPEQFTIFVSMCKQNANHLYEMLGDISFESISQPNKLVELVKNWAEIDSSMIDSDQFKLNTSEKLKQWLSKEKVSFHSVIKLLEELKRLPKEAILSRFVSSVESEVIELLFNNIGLSRINYEELKYAAKVVNEYQPPINVIGGKERSSYDNFEIVQALTITISKEYDGDYKLSQLLKKTSPSQFSTFQEQYNRLLHKNYNKMPKDYMKYAEGSIEGHSYLNIASLLQKLFKLDKDFIYTYIVDQAQFIQKNTKGLSTFLDKNKLFFENKKQYQEMMKQLPKKLAAIFREKKLKHSNFVLRLFVQYRKFVLLGMGIILLGLIISVVLIVLLKQDNTEVIVPTPIDSPSVEQTPTPADGEQPFETEAPNSPKSEEDSTEQTPSEEGDTEQPASGAGENLITPKVDDTEHDATDSGAMTPDETPVIP